MWSGDRKLAEALRRGRSVAARQEARRRQRVRARELIDEDEAKRVEREVRLVTTRDRLRAEAVEARKEARAAVLRRIRRMFG